MNLPSLPGLLALDAAARHQSFSRAARALHITPSAVSHRIRALEEELGVALFTRHTRRIRLTPEGRALAAATADALAVLHQAIEALRPAPDDGVLTVSCSPSFAVRWLVPRLPRLTQAHPALTLRLDATDRLVDLDAEPVDAAIRFGAGGWPGVRAVKLADEVVFPVCSPLLSRVGPPLEHPGDLRHHTLLHDTALERHPDRVGWPAWLAAAQAKGVDGRAGPRFSHANLALEAALAGQGVALARRTLVTAELSDGRLVRPFALTLPSPLTYWLVTRASGPERPALQAFAGWLARTVTAG
ncbi:MAG: transcriptional regulator GcvA [Alphaproteobacteria bacterium]|nr:transcriptional regulator GcvA [Alphaproteobacteria bacterium]